MARKRITFIQDESKMAVHSTAIEDALRHWKDVEQDSIKVERLPDPPIVERYLVEIITPATHGPIGLNGIHHRLATLYTASSISVSKAHERA